MVNFIFHISPFLILQPCLFPHFHLSLFGSFYFRCVNCRQYVRTRVCGFWPHWSCLLIEKLDPFAFIDTTPMFDLCSVIFFCAFHLFMFSLLSGSINGFSILRDVFHFKLSWFISLRFFKNAFQKIFLKLCFLNSLNHDWNVNSSNYRV